MVSDTAFIIVLGSAILVIGGLIYMIIMIIRQMKNPLMGNVMTTLHSTLFGYEKAMIELIGTRGYKSHVFPQIVDTINGLGTNSKIMATFKNSKNLDESMQNWMILLEKAGIVKKGKVSKIAENEYEIFIPYCMLHDPIHKEIGDQKGICPMALMLTAAGSIVDKNLEPEIEYSEFHATGTTTRLKFNPAAVN